MATLTEGYRLEGYELAREVEPTEQWTKPANRRGRMLLRVGNGWYSIGELAYLSDLVERANLLLVQGKLDEMEV
jgi:hypothetical protein